MTDLPVAHDVRPAGHWTGAFDQVTLDYESRFLRRKRLATTGGHAFLVDLAETVSLRHGDAFVLADGRLVEVIAAAEGLLEITGPGLARLAWHIGNRHTPCQIEPDRLLIRSDHVLAEMLSGLGAQLRTVSAPFNSEGGAYGAGRTLGHDHGPGPHSHAADAAGHRHVHTHVARYPSDEDGEADAALE